MFSLHLIDKQTAEIKALALELQKNISHCDEQGEFAELIHDTIEIEVDNMARRHSYELASLLHTEENTMNLKLLNSVNIIHFKTLLQNVISKMEIRTERRNVINIIENFFKDQSLIEIELNHLKFVKQKSGKLVWLPNEEHDEFMANNFNKVNEIDLLLMPIVILTSDRHVEMASMILMELPSTLEWRNKCLKAFSNTSENKNKHEPDPKKIWLKSFDKIIYRLTLLGDMQAFDLVRIEEHFKVDVGRKKNTKAYQVLEFLNSTLIKNLILREDDNSHEECRTACVKFMDNKRNNRSYNEFSSTSVITETEKNSRYFNDLSWLNI